MGVAYLAYKGTLQAEALALVAKKLQASLAVEGDPVDDDLAAHADTSDDLLLPLARSLTQRVEASHASLESLFASARQVEAEGALRSDDFTPELEGRCSCPSSFCGEAGEGFEQATPAT